MQHILLEFWDKDTEENLTSLLHYRYDAAYYFFFKEVAPTPSEMHTMRSVIKKNYGFTPNFFLLSRPSIPDICDSFNEIMEKHPSSIFDIDITGGFEVFITAVGYYISNNHSNHIHVRLFHARNDQLLFDSSTMEASNHQTSHLPLEDFVKLRGAVILHHGISASVLHTEKRRHEILRLFSALRPLSAEWNRFCSLSFSMVDSNNKTFLRKAIKANEISSAEGVLKALQKATIVSSYKKEEIHQSTVFTYTLSRGCTLDDLYMKSGSILEMYSSLALCEMNQYRDIFSGVIFDWKHKEGKNHPETLNEIDVVFMADNHPVFVSCKNTVPTKDHLYEIQVMAKHFGGKYAKAALFCTQHAPEAVKKRAEESDVILIDRISQMSLEDFKDKLRLLSLK